MQENIRKLESIVHPLVAKHRHSFLQSVAEQTSQKLVVLDIPLLFETKGENEVTMHLLASWSSLVLLTVLLLSRIYVFDTAGRQHCCGQRTIGSTKR